MPLGAMAWWETYGIIREVRSLTKQTTTEIVKGGERAGEHTVRFPTYTSLVLANTT